MNKTRVLKASTHEEMKRHGEEAGAAFMYEWRRVEGEVYERYRGRVEEMGTREEMNRLVKEVRGYLEGVVDIGDYYNTELGDGGEKGLKLERGVLDLMVKGILGLSTRESVLESVKSKAMDAYRMNVIGEGQSHIRGRLPEGVMKYLPSNIMIELDPYGKIKEVADILGNEERDLRHKMDTMRRIVKCYNEFVTRVKVDMISSDKKTQMLAAITALIIETGIRPAADLGKSPLKDKEGKFILDEEGGKIMVETFGAASLRLDHLSVGFLEFQGKAGTWNKASFGDGDFTLLVATMEEIAAEAEMRGKGLSVPPFLFVLPDGERVSKSMLEHYFNTRLGGVSPTDFRKLKGTRVVFESLRARQKKLLEKIKSFYYFSVDDLKKRVAEEVIETIEAALKDAQVALNHEDVATTIGAYVNPMVVLNYIEKGGVQETLEEAVLTQPSELIFNIDAFISKASNHKTAKLLNPPRNTPRNIKRAHLLEIIQNLEEELDVSSGILSSPTPKTAHPTRNIGARNIGARNKWAAEEIADLDDALEALEDEFGV